MEIKDTVLDEKVASIEKQQAWEQELEDIGIELERKDISDFTRRRLERREAALQKKFAKVREQEKAEAGMQEELTNREKLQAAYPELNFSMYESVADMDKRCEKCNTLLNDSGTCPKCDHGEEDMGDTELEEGLTAAQKLKARYPELNFDKYGVTESVEEEDEYADYDDDYEFDDVEEDRAHAALFGGDRTYCSCCGEKLTRTEWGSYCPKCEPDDDYSNYDDEV